MNYQTKPMFDLVPIPAPRERVRRMMQAAALFIDGPVETQPQRFGDHLANTLTMPLADVLIVGTACDRPLLLREVKELAAASASDALIVRDHFHRGTSFDLMFHECEEWLCCYRLWGLELGGSVWLIPTGGEKSFIRLSPLGLETWSGPPYRDAVERREGLDRAAQFLDAAVQGWF